MDYESCIEKLYAAKSLKSGLQNMQNALTVLGNPHEKFASIHVAGTNGKGSVVTKCAYALTLQGYKVGLYTSPHISSFCERIKINGQMISEDEVVMHLERLFTLEGLSFFEYATLLAFLHFEKQKIDIAVLETGLGGRLDATNVCTPCVSVITSISLDHTQILGSTLAEIAKEKAGIIKPGVPVVVGPSVPLKATYVVEGEFSDYEGENRAIAKKTLEVLPEKWKVSSENINLGITEVPDCRFQKVSHPYAKVILDVAHNPDGMKQLFKRVQKTYPDSAVCVVAAFSEDKDVDGCLESIALHADSLFCVQADSDRALKAKKLCEKAKSSCPNTALFSDDNLERGVQRALVHAKKK